MDLIDWVTASRLITFKANSTADAVLDSLNYLKKRGFISEFFSFPIITKRKENSVTLRRKPSWFLPLGPKCHIKAEEKKPFTILKARIWHGPIFSAWLAAIYLAALLIPILFLLVSAKGENLQEMAIVASIGIAISVGTILFAGTFNAINRIAYKKQIEAYSDILKKLEEEHSRHVEG